MIDPAGTLDVNGVELSFASSGHGPGPALVLCHGYTGSSHDFSLQVDALAEHRRVITLDLRGHGHSTKTGDASTYTIAQFTDDLAAFIAAVGGGPVDLLGHSMGGRISLGVALARPDLVRSLVLMDTSAWSFRPIDPAVEKLMGDFLDAFDPSGGVPRGFTMAGPEDALIEAATTAVWRQEKDELLWGTDAYAVKALGLALLDDGVQSVRADLGTITVPVTVIVGSNDHPFIDQAPQLVAELPSGRLDVIGGAYHSPQLTHPAQWRSAIEAHLAPLGS